MVYQITDRKLTWWCSRCDRRVPLGMPGLRTTSDRHGSSLAECPSCRSFTMIKVVEQRSGPAQTTAVESAEKLRALELQIRHHLTMSHNGCLPCELVFTKGTVLGGLTIVAVVPGQTRAVHLTNADLALDFSDLVEKAVEDVGFAVYVLLEEDQGDV